MLHVYVLDYTLGEILHFTCDYDADIETMLESHHIYVDDCYYMVTERELKIQELN